MECRLQLSVGSCLRSEPNLGLELSKRTSMYPRAPQPFRPMIPEIGDALIGQGPMDEDCLRLDIWTPRVERGASRPVMVWLHGGGFMHRVGQRDLCYNGRELARKHDVVIVTVTHRLHALGNLISSWTSWHR